MDAGGQKKSWWISISDFLISWKLFLIIHGLFFGAFLLEILLVLLPLMAGGEGKWQVNGNILLFLQACSMLLLFAYWPISTIFVLVRMKWTLLNRLLFLPLLWIFFVIHVFWWPGFCWEHHATYLPTNGVYSSNRDKTYFVAKISGFECDEAFVRAASGRDNKWNLTWEIVPNSGLNYGFSKHWPSDLLSVYDMKIALTPDQEAVVIYGKGIYIDLVDLDTGVHLADDGEVSDRFSDKVLLERGGRIKKIMDDRGWSEVCPK